MQPRAKNAAPRDAIARDTQPADLATAQHLPQPKAWHDPRDAYEQVDQLARGLEG